MVFSETSEDYQYYNFFYPWYTLFLFLTIFLFSRMRTKTITTLASKLQDLYEAIINYQDLKGRTLSTPFLKLPLKSVSVVLKLLKLFRDKYKFVCRG